MPPVVPLVNGGRFLALAQFPFEHLDSVDVAFDGARRSRGGPRRQRLDAVGHDQRNLAAGQLWSAGLFRVHDGLMGRWKWVIGGAAACVAGASLGLFLVSEGLNQASAWVTVLGFPLVLAGAAAGVWAAVLAARTARETRQAGMPSEQEGQGPSETSKPARPGIDTPGSIWQQGDHNTIHTGQGDINLNITER